HSVGIERKDLVARSEIVHGAVALREIDPQVRLARIENAERRRDAHLLGPGDVVAGSRDVVAIDDRALAVARRDAEQRSRFVRGGRPGPEELANGRRAQHAERPGVGTAVAEPLEVLDRLLGGLRRAVREHDAARAPRDERETLEERVDAGLIYTERLVEDLRFVVVELRDHRTADVCVLVVAEKRERAGVARELLEVA